MLRHMLQPVFFILIVLMPMIKKCLGVNFLSTANNYFSGAEHGFNLKQNSNDVKNTGRSS